MKNAHSNTLTKKEMDLLHGLMQIGNTYGGKSKLNSKPISERRKMTYEELLHEYDDAIIWAFNIGDGYDDIVIADSTNKVVFAVYTLTHGEMWIENDEFGAIGHELRWCKAHLCGAFPMWKPIHDVKLEALFKRINERLNG